MHKKSLIILSLFFGLALTGQSYGQTSCEAPSCPTLTITGTDKVFNGQQASYILSGASSGNIRWSVDNPNASISGNNNGATLTVNSACDCNNGTITITAKDTQTGCSGTFRVQAGTWVLIRYKWCNCANNNGCGTGSDCGSCGVHCQPAQDVTEGLYRWKFQFGWMCSNPPDSPYIKCKPCADDFVNWIGGDLPSSYTPRCSSPYTCNPPNTLTEAFVSPYEKYEWKCPTTSQSCSTTCSLNITDFMSSSNAIDPHSGETVCLSGLIDANNSVTWTIEIKDGTGSTVKSFTGGNAYVSTSWDGKDNNGNIVAGGTYTVKLTAKTGSGTCADSKELPITVRTVRRAYLKYVSGNNQAGDILASLENPFVVKVVDGNNNPTAGNVTWHVTATPQDGQGHGLSATSGLSTTLTLGDALGNYTVTATCTDCTENTTVAFTARASGPKITLKLEPEDVQPSRTGGNSVAEVIAEVTSYNGTPLNGYGVEFKAEADETSGGHDSGHNAGRPAGSFSDNSICYTDNGQCAVKYTASEFGGKEKITAKLQSLRFENIPPQSKDLTVKVPELGSLGGGAYSLKCDAQDCSDYKHSNFYNVASWVKGLFGKIATAYHEKFPNASSLVVTDASLLWGGLYDYKNTWAPPHNTHRIGTDIDVRSKAIPDKNKSKFEEFVCSNYGFPKLEYEGLPNEHYHIYFFPYNATTAGYCDGGPV